MPPTSKKPSKKKRRSASIEDEKPVKKTCVRCSEDPDITIVVGGTEFQEYRPSLRCWSQYFDRALCSGMKEEFSRAFEFPDRDPREWEWVVSLMAPLPKERVTMEKLNIALDWFDFLSSDLGLSECDRVLHKYLPPPPVTGEFSEVTENDFAKVMNYFETTIKYNLSESKAVSFQIIKTAIKDHLTLFDQNSLKIICSLILEDRECRNQFLEPLKAHLPPTITAEQVKMLLENHLLHQMVHLETEKQRLLEQRSSLTRTLVDIVDDSECMTVERDLRSDAGWGQLVRPYWD